VVSRFTSTAACAIHVTRSYQSTASVVCQRNQIIHLLYAAPRLPLELRFQPRRIAFHAQVRTEAKLGGGRIEAALADLRVADANGLLDILWLDRCALFDKVRDRPEFIAIRKSTASTRMTSGSI